LKASTDIQTECCINAEYSEIAIEWPEPEALLIDRGPAPSPRVDALPVQSNADY
jgi:hypothetical protein